MKPKLIKFNEEEHRAIQSYANVNTNGNFTQAVKEMCEIVIRDLTQLAESKSK